ncbi:MerR family transcriptional regulator [Alkalihalobacillus hwajinpoensis]|uniref:MerR family transcriptional regulator n=1 Tax=Guptibacillus hwajinpoensis TaxID=208199 RepID=UPI001883ACC1|nr:MerR family transcriptional regulator [Pseudalkalibacillus hwajinpoensis]MBF0707550.1 MerR family transcriptional regulator [Pseudalkalibacillus hwajinpoensis]
MDNHYSMKEITSITGITASALRYYEKEKILPFIERNQKGVRRYNDQNLEWIHFILALRSTNMSIAEIKWYVNLYHQGEETIEERRKLLHDHQQKVAEEVKLQQKYLKRISKKIALYDDVTTDLQTIACEIH